MILVTGGAGYIGSHCALALLKKGLEVVIFDNLSTGHIVTVEKLKTVNKENLHFVEGDLLNYSDINSVFLKNKIDAVIHFAAFSQVAESVKNPSKYYRNNVVGTLNLLDSMKDNNVDKIVFSSTAATYGEPKYIPIDENHPKEPINPYGQSKLMIEHIMDDYNNAYDIKSVRLRYFNVAGADSNKLIGEWHEPETHLIPNILKSTFSNAKTFQMFGVDYKTKDGTCVRDYINIEDLISAHLLALDYLNNSKATNFFNLGTNEGSTVKEVFSVCEKITGKNIPVEIKNRRPGDPAALVADNKKAKEILNWEPKNSLEYSVKTAFEWEKILNSQNPSKF